MEADDLKRVLHGHVRTIEQSFTALRRAEALRARDPERDMAAKREAIRRAAGTFTVAALGGLRELLIGAAFWCGDSTELVGDFDCAVALLPEPSEDWRERFLVFLTALRHVLLTALAAVDRAPGAEGAQPPVLARPVGAAVSPVLLNVRAAAGAMGLSEKAVRHQIDAGKLPVVRRGRRVFVNARALERQIEAGTEFRA